VVWDKPQAAPTAFSAEEFDALPQTLPVRLIRLRVATPGFRTHTVVLATTLLDSEAYPADAIRALYARRWGVELHFHQIKTLLSLDILRCKSPDLIEKELAIHLIAYDLVRVLMQRAAHLHHIPLDRISFKGTLDTARHFADVIHAASSTPRKQQRPIDDMLTLIARDLLPERPGRCEPRAKKRRPKIFQNLPYLTAIRDRLPVADQIALKPWRGCVECAAMREDDGGESLSGPVASPFSDAESHAPHHRRRGKAFPLWITLGVLLISLLAVGGVFLFQHLNDPLRTLESFPVSKYLDGYKSVAGLKFRADLRVENDLGWKEGTGRLMVFTLRDDHHPIVVMIPAAIGQVYFTKGQNYVAELEVKEGGLIYANTVRKN